MGKSLLARRIAIAVGVWIGIAFFSRPLRAQTAPEITVTPITCAPPTDKYVNLAVHVTVKSAGSPASVRVYFHAEGDLYFHNAQGKVDDETAGPYYRDKNGQTYFHPDYHLGDHYHEMRRGDHDGEYWTVLPKIGPGTTFVDFKIVVADQDGHQFSSMDQRFPVTPSCPVESLTDTEKRAAANIVEGKTDDRQSAVPPGFLCDGIVSFITTGGDLRPNDECRRCACGIVPLEWIAGGAALIGGGITTYHNGGGGGGGKPPISAARP